MNCLHSIPNFKLENEETRLSFEYSKYYSREVVPQTPKMCVTLFPLVTSSPSVEGNHFKL